MHEASRARTWAGRGVLVIAALASIATSRPRWHLEPVRPAGAPTATPQGGTRGLAVTVEASAEPSVGCNLPGLGYRELRPLTPSAGSASSSTQTQYLCPPGGSLDRIIISGHNGGNGCKEPQPPPDQFVRITKLEAVETWSVSAEASFTIPPPVEDPTYSVVKVVVQSSQQPFLETSIEPGPGSTAFGTPSVLGGGGAQYEIVIPLNPNTKQHEGRVHLRATIYGACTPTCTPPAADALTIAGS